MTEGEVGLERSRRPARVWLAWRLLTYDKGRTILAIAGVFMAILLIFVELGFFFAVPQGGMLLYDNLRFDLLMCSKQYEYQAQPGQFPRGQLDRARSAPEVAQEARSGSHLRARWRLSAVQPSLRARLHNYFLIVRPHHDDLAAKVIRQRMRKIVYRVSFVRQIG